MGSFFKSPLSLEISHIFSISFIYLNWNILYFWNSTDFVEKNFILLDMILNHSPDLELLQINRLSIETRTVKS